jgi:hypothetical protein
MPKLARNAIRLLTASVASAPDACRTAKSGVILAVVVIGVGAATANADVILAEDVSTICSMAATGGGPEVPGSPGQTRHNLPGHQVLKGVCEDALPSGGPASSGHSTGGASLAILCPLCCVNSPDQLGRLGGELSLTVPSSPVFERLRPPRI